MNQSETVLHIEKLKLSLPMGRQELEILHGVDLQVRKGRILGILGESGSGKTVTMMASTGLIDQSYAKIHGGCALFAGMDLLKLRDRELADIRGKRIGFVFQNAIDAMNPYQRVKTQMSEVFRLHGLRPAAGQLSSALEQVGIDDAERVLNMYPSQLSGGMAQRVMIAMAGLLSPELIIADEPTSAIDASLRKMILDLFIELKNERGISIAMITHDFDVVAYACDDVAVMYGGLIMEAGPKISVMESPEHPYTQGLIQCATSLGKREKNLFELAGQPLAPKEYQGLCPFMPRCGRVVAACMETLPDMTYCDGRQVRCHNPLKGGGINA